MRKFLSMVESAKLIAYIQEHYANAALNDGEFAAQAAKDLGFEVSRTQITNRRDELAIPQNTRIAKPVAGDLLQVSERLEAMERQLAADQKEFRGLATLFLEFRTRLEVLERAARLKGTFETPKG